MIRLLLALALLVPASARADDRRISIGSFDRVRVDGPFDVKLATGASPGGTISGDARAIDTVDVRVDGTTLVVRKGLSGWGEQKASSAPMVVSLSTPDLVSAVVVGGGRLSIGRMKGMRIDLSVSGAGTIALAAADTDQLNALVIGTGRITLAGRAARARLVTNGTSAIDASGLETGDLVVRLDGMGEIKAQARYTADVTNTGLGEVTIAGPAKCIVKAAAGGPVTCGQAAP